MVYKSVDIRRRCYGTGFTRKRLENYLIAHDLMAANDGTAREVFLDQALKFPADPLIRFHLHRLEIGEKGLVIRMAEK
jgi:hypothetical protein